MPAPPQPEYDDRVAAFQPSVNGDGSSRENADPMKQILQSLKDGTTTVADVPAPRAGAGQVLIQTSVSLVSAGTERMLVEFGKANIVQKVRQQPDKVRMVLEKAATDGIAATLDAVRSKLDQPLELGYCNVGRVLESRADGFQIGDRVVSNGKHAEIVGVPRNLCARIPDDVSDEAASFTVLAAIGLQGIRLAAPTLGESVVVMGLGLIGLLTVQMLRAQGVRVMGVDFDPARLALAERAGAEVVNPAAGEDVLARAMAFSRGAGIDAVIITASSKSNDLVSQSARMCRKRGRIVLVGVVGLKLNRADFYEKELSFQVSCSYGPGRYDPDYEQGGHDYPLGFVRWTEQRNFEAVLDLMQSGALDVEPLISHRFALDRGDEAMALLSSGEPSLGILITYPEARVADRAPARTIPLGPLQTARSGARLGVLGAGNYAGRVLIPAFKEAGASMSKIASAGGVSAVHFGKKFGFASATTDSAEIFDDPDIDAVVIATQHASHANQVLQALRADKHVFCEKPLCLTQAELTEIAEEASARPQKMVMVGFNRRFAPLVQRMQSLLSRTDAPRAIVMTINAGEIDPEHWTQDRAAGGGRIIGEACHFIDLARFLAAAPITSCRAVSIGRHPIHPIRDDKAMMTVEFANGSIASIQYLANGHKGFPKERIEVFAAGRVLQLDNFRRLRGWGWDGFTAQRAWRQDKGQAGCTAAFMDAMKTVKPSPIPFAEVVEVHRTTIDIANALASGTAASSGI